MGPLLPPPLTSYEPIHKMLRLRLALEYVPGLPSPSPALRSPTEPRHGTAPQGPPGTGNPLRGKAIPGERGWAPQPGCHRLHRGAGSAVPSDRPPAVLPDKIQGQRRLPEIFPLS